MTDRTEIAEGEMSAGRSLVEEMATKIPGGDLKDNFHQRVFEVL
jgi:hypothetical protein